MQSRASLGRAALILMDDDGIIMKMKFDENAIYTETQTEIYTRHAKTPVCVWQIDWHGSFIQYAACIQVETERASTKSKQILTQNNSLASVRLNTFIY